MCVGVGVGVGQPFHCCFAGDLGGNGVKVWDGEGGHELMGVKHGSGQKLQFVLIFVWSNCFS